MRGKFIVIYGPNNLGKTAQVTRLVEWLKQNGQSAIGIKYPIYDSPTGQRINRELRGQRTMSDLELQREFAANRRLFEPELVSKLNAGFHVVAEDYTHTGIVWGLVSGLPESELLELNKDLLQPDISFLLDGERYTSGIERGHRFEDSGLWDAAREAHLRYAKELGWNIVNANESQEAVHDNIAAIVNENLFV